MVDVSRVERILERHPRFAHKHFAPDEVEYCDSQSRRAECYAARWAAREAFAKAVGGIPGGRWRDVHVVRQADGAVRLELDGSARARLADLGGTEVHVSLAHERTLALAFCVALG